MLVRLYEDKHGFLLLSPVSKGSKKLTKQETGDTTLLIQHDWNIWEAYEDFKVTPTQQKDLESGWDVVKQFPLERWFDYMSVYSH